ncbi:hypothetical protein PIB30_073917, partial [Stylosanthes scabra]|nr:hypothetical protein [Stylosanthes scabra]
MDAQISSSSFFPAMIITGLVITTFFLLGYYIFVIKFCLNLQSGSLVRRRGFTLRRNEALATLSPEPEHRGLEEAIIWSIPVIHYKNCDESSSKCSVCLNEFQQNEKLRAIPNCNHTFHIDCIDIWLQNNDNCPLCRTKISLLSGRIDVAAGEIKAAGGPTTSPQDQISQVENENRVVSGYDLDSVVINLENEDDTRDRNSEAEDVRIIRKKVSKVSSMGDEGVVLGVRAKGDEQFLVHPIRRAFSMDSLRNSKFFLEAEQDLMHQNNIHRSCL